MSKITIYDIAKEAKVSPATVSRVMSGKSNVSEKKVEAVEQVIKKYNYSPSPIASGLKTNITNSILFLVPDIKNPYFSNIYYETDLKSIDSKFTLSLANSFSSTDMESKILNSYTNNKCDSIVFMGGRIDDIHCPEYLMNELININKKIPMILTSKVDNIPCSQIYNDDEQGMKILVEYLYSKGHTEVALVGGYNNIRPSRNRRVYFQKYAEQYGLIIKKEWIIDSDFSSNGGEKAMEKIMDMAHKPTAICAVNDLVAIGAYNYAKRKGLQIPYNIAIFGCDGIIDQQLMLPNITTVASDFAKYGEEIFASCVSIYNDTYTPRKKAIKMVLRKGETG